jgi:transcription-repair coupling factor (superfamily II helicase)
VPEPTASKTTKLTGICPAAQGHALTELLRRYPVPVWLVLHEEAQKTDALAEDIALFHAADSGTAKLEILSFPEAQAGEMREAFTAASDRLAVLSKLRGLKSASAKSGTLLVLTTPAALLQPVPPPADFATREAELVRGEQRPFQGLLELLRSFDYDSEAVCEAPGQYAVRGGIVDVYPITAHQPYRLDFFGDTLEEIKALDPVTQRSGEAVERIILTAAPKLHTSGLSTSLLDYLPAGAHAAIIEPKWIEELFDLSGRANPPDEPSSLGSSGRRALPFERKLADTVSHLFGLSDLDLASDLFDGAATEETWDTESLSHHRAYPEERLLAHERLQAEEDARREFLEQVAKWRTEGYAVDFVVSKEGEEQRVRELLDEHPALAKIKPRFLRGTLTEGFRVTFRGGRANPPDEPSSHCSIGAPLRA